MARRGESHRALKFALYSSVTGDTISDLLLIVLVVPFAAILQGKKAEEFLKTQEVTHWVQR